MEAVLLALTVAACWGVGDFVGSLLARCVAVLVVVGGMQTAAMAASLLYLATSDDTRPDGRSLAASAAAGLVSAASLGLFYKALSVGRASIVAPVSATGVALPVIVGLATGERPGDVALAGIAAAAVGVVVVLATAGGGDDHDGRGGRLPVLLALCATLGFGAFLILSDVAADGGVPWFIAVARLTSALPLIVLALALRPPLPRLRSRVAVAIVGVGLVDAVAWAASGAAFRVGDLATVSVLISLYPVITVLLAAGVARERLRPIEVAGVVLALAGVVMIAGG